MNSSAIADTLHAEGFLDVKDLSADMKKDWRRPAAVLLRLAIFFGLSAVIRETSLSLLTNGHQCFNLDIIPPKVLGFPTGLEAVSP